MPPTSTVGGAVLTIPISGPVAPPLPTVVSVHDWLLPVSVSGLPV